MYGADGYAVKELLKLATVLNNATNIATVDKDGGDEEGIHLNSSKFQENVKSIRGLSTELTEIGSSLFDLLDKELDLSVSSYRIKPNNHRKSVKRL